MLNFVKMQAYGNDYIYINMLDRKLDNLDILAKKITDRHLGVGGDGLVLIMHSDKADFKMRIFNPDGTEAQMCGNAIRSVAKYVFLKGLTDKKELKIETLGGIKELKLIVKDSKLELIETNLGKPDFDINVIPVKINKDKFFQEKVRILDKEFLMSSLSWGNPHTGLMVDNLEELDIEKYGPLIENNDLFPERTNVTFFQVVDRTHLKIREWERGTGETIGCATGCATALVIANLLNLVDSRCIIEQRGGSLEAFITDTKEVKILGNTHFVFEGTLDDEFFKEGLI